MIPFGYNLQNKSFREMIKYKARRERNNPKYYSTMMTLGPRQDQNRLMVAALSVAAVVEAAAVVETVGLAGQQLAALAS